MKSLKLAIIATTLVALTSCDKVSFTGILIGNTGVDDRVEMSYAYNISLGDAHRHYKLLEAKPDGSYSYLIGSDSHMIDDPGRICEMMNIMLTDDDLFCAHLGDVVDTKPEYYAILKASFKVYKDLYYITKKGYVPDSISDETKYVWKRPSHENPDSMVIVGNDELETMEFPFYATVGNHDLTHNGWTLFADVFHSSFYQALVLVQDEGMNNWKVDRHIFLDSANGTLGQYQIDLLDGPDPFVEELGSLGVRFSYRNTYVYTHSNLFRPTSDEFASTYAREELYYLLNKFADWNVNTVFMGHVHKWDERYFGGVHYVTLDAMSERNSPEPGDYLVRVNVDPDGNTSISKVHMNYVSPKKK